LRRTRAQRLRLPSQADAAEIAADVVEIGIAADAAAVIETVAAAEIAIAVEAVAEIEVLDRIIGPSDRARASRSESHLPQPQLLPSP
jgi:hypothetical protein